MNYPVSPSLDSNASILGLVSCDNSIFEDLFQYFGLSKLKLDMFLVNFYYKYFYYIY